MVDTKMTSFDLWPLPYIYHTLDFTQVLKSIQDGDQNLTSCECRKSDSFTELLRNSYFMRNKVSSYVSVTIGYCLNSSFFKKVKVKNGFSFLL